MGGRTAVGSVVFVWLALVCWTPAPWGCMWAILAALSCAGLAWRAPPRVGTLLVLLALAFAAAARGGAARTAWDVTRAAVPDDGAIARWRVVIDEPPRGESGEPQARVRVLAATPAMARGARVRLRFPPDAVLARGDRADVVVRVDRLGLARNPGGYDALAAGRAEDIVATGRAYVVHAVAPSPLATGLEALAPARLAARVRRGIEQACARRLSPSARELVTPLLIGDRSGMSPESAARLRAAGLIHLLALSGLHVVWFAGVVRGLAALLGAGLVTRAALGAGSALAYLAVAGPYPSLLRAVAGECWSTLAVHRARALDPLQGLALSALALLVVSPSWSHDLGFQLSCAATLGLVTLAPAWQAVLPDRGPARRLLAPILLTAAAQMVTLPLLVLRFHALPWSGLLANLLAVPLAELLLSGGVLLVGFECVAPGSGRLWASACEWVTAAMTQVASHAAALPGAQMGVGNEQALPALLALGAAGVVIASLAPRALAARAHGPSPVRFWAGLLGGALFAAGLLAILTVPPLRPPGGRWWLVAIDVGQGDALAIGTRGGWWLVDAGPRQPRGDAGESAVLPFLRWAGVRELEGIVLTHDDGDHVGGAPAVRRGVRVRRTFVATPLRGVPGPAHRFPGARPLARGDLLAMGAIRARVLWPPDSLAPDAAIAARGDNAASVVLEIGSRGGRALLPGDADSLVEARLACAPGIAVLKAGHHGSASSSGTGFLTRVPCRWALISAGRRNRYGHPTDATLARLGRVGARLARTDHSGAVWFELGPDGARPLAWRRRAPDADAVASHAIRAHER